MSTARLQEWFASPLGAYVLGRERAFFDQAVADVFGFHAAQFGLPECRFLEANRAQLRMCAGTDPGVTVRADFGHLPFESNSIDLAILPHVLEFSADPHQILREVGRIMIPEGQVILSGFNPRSLLGIGRWLVSDRTAHPWCGSFISLPRLKDWLALLDFEVTGGQFACYVPPVSQDKWIARYSFMDDAGDRWWPVAGGVYFVQAVKRVHGMRVIKPNWLDLRAARRSLAPVAQRATGEDTRLAARRRLKVAQ